MRKSCQESQKHTIGRSFYSKFGKRVKKVDAWTWFTQSRPIQGLYKDNSAIFKDLFPSELFAKAFV